MNNWKLYIDSGETADNVYYNDNGTKTSLKATTYDTLPVGAIVEYTGSTIPDGWTDIGNNQIEKTSQYLEVGASISNVYGTSQENGYSQEYLNGFNNLKKINEGTMGDSSVEHFTIAYNTVYLYINSHVNNRSIILISVLNATTYRIDEIYKSGSASGVTVSVSGTTLTITNPSNTRASLYQLTKQICG